jgi:hypothetical protein
MSRSAEETTTIASNDRIVEGERLKQGSISPPLLGPTCLLRTLLVRDVVLALLAGKVDAIIIVTAVLFGDFRALIAPAARKAKAIAHGLRFYRGGARRRN